MFVRSWCSTKAKVYIIDGFYKTVLRYSVDRVFCNFLWNIRDHTRLKCIVNLFLKHNWKHVHHFTTRTNRQTLIKTTHKYKHTPRNTSDCLSEHIQKLKQTGVTPQNDCFTSYRGSLQNTTSSRSLNAKLQHPNLQPSFLEWEAVSTPWIGKHYKSAHTNKHTPMNTNGSLIEHTPKIKQTPDTSQNEWFYTKY